MDTKSTFIAHQSKKPDRRAPLGVRLLSLALAFSIVLAPTSSSAAVVLDEDPPVATETNLPVIKWNDDAQRDKATVLMLHGISQRSYTLRKIANSLAEKGFVTYGMDLRGHGWWHKTLNKKDDGYRSNYKKSQADVKEVLAALKQKHPDKPLYLMGESVGAAVALRAANDSPELVDGLILCGAGSKAHKAKITWVMTDLVKCMFRKPVNIVRYQQRYGTEDLRALQETIEDPDQRKTFSFREILSASRYLRKNNKFAKSLDPNISVLVVHGEEDKTLTCKSAKKVYEDLTNYDKKLVLVPKCGHILLGTNYPKDLVTNSIVGFIDDRASYSRVAYKDIPAEVESTEAGGTLGGPSTRGLFRQTSMPVDTVH